MSTTALRVTVAFMVLSVALVGCKSSGPQVETAPAATPTPRPTPTPQAITEEVIEEPTTAAVPSVEVSAEELPADLAVLNARGYLQDVFFDTDSFELRPDARQTLSENADWLREYPTVQVLVEGHCDERNTREYNLALGERRANAVRDYLVFLGIGSDRVRTISYGEERPFAIGHDEEAWQLNRRAHFVITSR